jgi:iron complex transport system ATP-binding protein
MSYSSSAQSPSTSDAIEMRAVRTGYGRADVLRGVDFVARRGRVCAVVGPNGCGKSTLLRVACGLLPPRGGQVLVGGRALNGIEARERARLFALLPQHPSAPESLAVRDLVRLGRTPHLSAYGILSARDEEKVEDALVRADVAQWAARPIGELSGGQRQRVFLARALAQEAPFLLLDEPISHLDLKFQFQILKLVRGLAHEEGENENGPGASTCRGVIVVLHHINLAAAVADDMVLMRDGVVVASGAPGEVMREKVLEDVFEVPLAISRHPVSGRPQAQSRWDFDTDSEAAEAVSEADS